MEEQICASIDVCGSMIIDDTFPYNVVVFMTQYHNPTGH